MDLCESLLRTRSDITPGAGLKGTENEIETQPVQTHASTPSMGFLSSIGKMLSQSASSVNTPSKSLQEQKLASSLERKPVLIMGMPLHQLEVCPIPLSSNTSPSSSSSDLWVPFPCPPSAIRLLSTALNVCLPSLGPGVSDQVWSQCLTAMICALSPWHLSELGAAGLSEGNQFNHGKSGEVDDQTSVSCCLSALVTHCLDYRTKPIFVVSLINALEIVCRLSVLSLGDLSKSLDSGTATQREASADPSPSSTTVTGTILSDQNVHNSSYYSAQMNGITTLSVCRSHLETLCCLSSIPRQARQRALLVILVITRDLANTVLLATETSNEIIVSLRECCGDYFELLARLNSTPDQLPTGNHFDPHTSISTQSDLKQQWCDTLWGILCLAEKSGGGGATKTDLEEHSDEDAHPETEREGRAVNMDADGMLLDNHLDFRCKGHVLLATPIAVRVLADISITDQSCERLRRATLKLISAVDVRSLVSSYRLALSEIQSEQQTNKQLRNELLTVRNAATLPF